MSTIPEYQFKGPAPAPSSFPGAEGLRIGIVHARWNSEVIDPLVRGAVQTLSQAGVKQENIVIESVPGSWELPFGVSRYVSPPLPSSSLPLLLLLVGLFSFRLVSHDDLRVQGNPVLYRADDEGDHQLTCLHLLVLQCLHPVSSLRLRSKRPAKVRS